MTELPPNQDPSDPANAPDAAQGATQPQPSPSQPEPPLGAPPQGGQQPPLPPGSPQQGYPQQGYPQPGYPQPGSPQQAFVPGGQLPPEKPPMNVFAIIGFVGVFFLGIVGVVLGHIALSQIKRTGEGGRGFALAATIIGYVRIAGEILGVIMLIGALGLFGAIATDAAGNRDDGQSTAPFDDRGHGPRTERFGPHMDGHMMDDPRFADRPWIGAENEAFCSALLTPGMDSMHDPVVYFEELIALTDDPELAAILKEQLEYVGPHGHGGTTEDARKRSESRGAWAETRSELALECVGETPAP